MSWVEVTGSHGYGYGLAIPDPSKTRTRDTGLTGITGVAELGDRVTASCNNDAAPSPTTPPDSRNDHKRRDGGKETVGMRRWRAGQQEGSTRCAPKRVYYFIY